MENPILHIHLIGIVQGEERLHGLLRRGSFCVDDAWAPRDLVMINDY